MEYNTNICHIMQKTKSVVSYAQGRKIFFEMSFDSLI